MTGKDFVDESRIAPNAMEDPNLGIQDSIRAMTMYAPGSSANPAEVEHAYMTNTGRHDPFKIHFDDSSRLSTSYAHSLENIEAREELLSKGNIFSVDESTSKAVTDGVSYNIDKSGHVTAQAVRSGDNARSVSNDGSVSVYMGADGKVKVGTPGLVNAVSPVSAEASMSTGVKGEESWNTSSTIQVRDGHTEARDMRAGETFQSGYEYKINGQWIEGSKFTEAISQQLKQTQAQKDSIANEYAQAQQANVGFDLDKQQFNNIDYDRWLGIKENAYNAAMSMADQNPHMRSVAADIVGANTGEEMGTIVQHLAQTDMAAAAKITQAYFTGQNDRIANQAERYYEKIVGAEKAMSDIEQGVQSPIDVRSMQSNFAHDLPQSKGDIQAKFENSDLYRNTVGTINTGEQRIEQQGQALRSQVENVVHDNAAKTSTTAADLALRDGIGGELSSLGDNLRQGNLKDTGKDMVNLAATGGTTEHFALPSEQGNGGFGFIPAAHAGTMDLSHLHQEPPTDHLTATGVERVNYRDISDSKPVQMTDLERGMDNSGRLNVRDSGIVKTGYHGETDSHSQDSLQDKNQVSGSVNDNQAKQSENQPTENKPFNPLDFDPKQDAWSRTHGAYGQVKEDTLSKENKENEIHNEDYFPKAEKLFARAEGRDDSYNEPIFKKDKHGNLMKDKKGNLIVSYYKPHHDENVGSTGKKISELTFNEIRQLQSDRKVFAVGNYQIIPDTLNGAVKKLKLTGDEKFTPELQDKIFREHLTSKAGGKDGVKLPDGQRIYAQGALRDYITGKSNDETAAFVAMAQEWASFPMPVDFVKKGISHKAGESYHGDDGFNNAHVTIKEAKEALKEMRENNMKHKIIK
ncbi:MAG: hypothetical protein IJV56_03535, partial [Neisseriaceae bacterium]|nr:hypothetical protein [Neisseriaceae bacterium]